MKRRRIRRPHGGPSARATTRFAVFALVTVSLTVYMAMRITGFTFQSSYTLSAQFDDVAGLKPGDLVKVDGAQVGHVDGVKVRLGKAVVSMSVRDDIRMPVDSTAVIRWRNLIGDREVYLQPGASESLLPHGAKIRHTESTVDLGTVINSLGPLTGSLNPQEINQILQAFATALNGNEGNINQITDNLGVLLNTFGSRTATIDQMIKDYKTVTDAVTSRDSEIATVVDNLTTLARAFNDSSTVLSNALQQLHTFTGNLNSTVGGQSKQLGEIIGSTKDLLNIAHNNMTTLHGIVNGLPTALQALLTTLDGGHFTRVAVVCLNINRYTEKCPFPDTLPPPAAAGGKKMTPQEQANFSKVASLFLLGATGAGGAN
jgi:phospholipid/cholesterol/gamma-HCH transport system substrate-binding protein